MTRGKELIIKEAGIMLNSIECPRCHTTIHPAAAYNVFNSKELCRDKMKGTLVVKYHCSCNTVVVIPYETDCRVEITAGKYPLIREVDLW